MAERSLVRHACEWCTLPIEPRPLDGPALHVDGKWWHRSCLAFALSDAVRMKEEET